jgi:flagellar biogenesis protein FliO
MCLKEGIAGWVIALCVCSGILFIALIAVVIWIVVKWRNQQTNTLIEEEVTHTR